MLLVLAAIAWVTLVATLLIRAVVQYRHYESLAPDSSAPSAPGSTVVQGGGGTPPSQEDSSAPGTQPPTVCVIVPARNEAGNIARCLKGLQAQEYPRLKIIVVNDNSTDTTASVVAELARADARIALIEGQPLPAGWAGKPHACWQGASAASADWLCFVDADTAASPALIQTAVKAAERRGLGLLSLEPFQELGGFWERLIIPVGFFVLAFAQDLRRVNDPHAAAAAANGQFILIRRALYQSLQGHAAVRAEICEDKALAKLVKSSGKKLALLGGEKLLRTRMYTGLPSLWEGLSKNVTEMIGGLAATALVGCAALGIGWASLGLPLWAAGAVASRAWFLEGQWLATAACLAIGLASAALFSTHIAGARYFGIPFWYGLLFPLGYTMGAIIAFNGVALRLRGRVPWKGRLYTPTLTVAQRK